ncbi:MAG: HAD family hydrolase, partial [Oscillospiraceae bacterium]|nr:HAD family hydrolase [Oscillospiraceae bacterium]
MSIKWLFFDLGGTVYDETLSDKQRIDNLIEKADLQMTYEDFYAEMLKAAKLYAPSPFAAARKVLGIAENVPYSNQMEKLYPNALDVIKKLSKSYSLGIIANQPLNTAERLKNDGLSDYFGICLLSECVDLFKPDRRFFEYALAEVGCAPGEAVMICDRLDNDISPAKSIGMKT